MSSSRSEKTLSRSGASASTGFLSLPLSLPIEARNEVYKYVLTVPHPLYLFQGPGGPVQTFAPEKPYRWLALLYINRQIYNEAKAILYGTNRFTLQEVEVETMQREDSLLNSILNCIGPVNAGLLSHLCINFPATRMIESQPGEIRLREDSLQSLQLLQKELKNLKTLETLVYSRNSRSLLQGNLDDTEPAQELFLEIDAQLKGIVSLDKFVVRICSGSPDPWAREFLEQLGWVVLVGGI